MNICLVLVLLAVSAMPSDAGQPLKQEQYLDANARYRSARHHHGHRFHTRHIRSPRIHERSSNVMPPSKMAEASVEPFDWKDYQPPIRWADVDVSTVLKPNDFVNFPPDPAPFKLPADPPVVKDYAPQEDWSKRKMFYTFALFLLAILITGSAREIGMLKTYHKVRPHKLRAAHKRPVWMPMWVWRQRNTLSKLT